MDVMLKDKVTVFASELGRLILRHGIVGFVAVVTLDKDQTLVFGDHSAKDNRVILERGLGAMDAPDGEVSITVTKEKEPERVKQ